MISRLFQKKILFEFFLFFFLLLFCKIVLFFPKNWCLTFTKKSNFTKMQTFRSGNAFWFHDFFFQKKFYLFFVNFIAKCFCIPNCAWRIQFVFSQYDEKWSVMRNWKLMKNDHPLPLFVFLFLSFSSSLDAHWEVERRLSFQK